jgi:uncharacterized membrane protein (UPF0136 family)
MSQAAFDDPFALAYGSITVIGGLIGYLKANSLISYSPSRKSSSRLISSSIFGGTIFYATTMLPRPMNARVLLGVGLFLGVFFGVRFVKSAKVMPAGVMTGIRYYSIYVTMVEVSAVAVVKYARELGAF